MMKIRIINKLNKKRKLLNKDLAIFELLGGGIALAKKNKSKIILYQ